MYCVRCCYKANSFTSRLKSFIKRTGLIILNRCTLNFLKSELESKSRLPIPEFSGA